jgi:uncharacterized protein YecE (DUF72 family)
LGIRIGLTGWGDHPHLYQTQQQKNKLVTYSSHFPTVEIDSSFYAIHEQERYANWVKQTPENFTFVIKAWKTMTGHDRLSLTNKEMKDITYAYKKSILPVVESNKLTAILMQFPPWFDLTSRNMNKIKKLRSWLGDLPVAIEFRNRTWFSPREKETLQFLINEQCIHVICDEPNAGIGSIPAVIANTNDKVIVRFHGRNVYGWNNHGQSNWREVRFLYRYNEQELREWVTHIRDLEKKAKEVTILFNNNSGGDAYDNAKQLIDMLNITYTDLHPKQMNLFDDSLF